MRLLLSLLLLLIALPAPAQAAPPESCILLQRQIRAPISPADQAPSFACLDESTIWWFQQSLAYQMSVTVLDSADRPLAEVAVRTAAVGWHTAPRPAADGAIVLALREWRADGADLTVYYLLPQAPDYLMPTKASRQPCRPMPLRPIVVPIALRMCGAVEAQRPDGRTIRIEWASTTPADIPARMELIDADGAVLWSEAYTTSGREVERVLVAVPLAATQFRLCEQWEGCATHDLPGWWAALPMVR